MKTAVISATIVFLLLGLFIILFLLFYSRRQRENRKEKQLMKSRFEQEILKTQIEIQEQTFKNISQEIHDNIGQVLSLAKLNLNTLPVSQDELVTIKLNDTKQLVGKAINDLRDISRSLHGEKIAEWGLKESIARELKFLQNSGKFKTSLEVTGNPYKLEQQKEIILFRIVQEAFNNSVKYSGADNISVKLNYNDADFVLKINDDGAGFDSTLLNSANTGIGLKNMQNRTKIIGGIFSLHSAPGKGTEIAIIITP